MTPQNPTPRSHPHEVLAYLRDNLNAGFAAPIRIVNNFETEVVDQQGRLHTVRNDKMIFRVSARTAPVLQ